MECIAVMRLQDKVLLAAAFNGEQTAAELLCKVYSDSLDPSSPGVDPDLLGAGYQVAVAQLGGCSVGEQALSSKCECLIFSSHAWC